MRFNAIRAYPKDLEIAPLQLLIHISEPTSFSCAPWSIVTDVKVKHNILLSQKIVKFDDPAIIALPTKS